MIQVGHVELPLRVKQVACAVTYGLTIAHHIQCNHSEAEVHQWLKLASPSI
jgi:hypothetical protein